jgi:hypothetical protein
MIISPISRHFGSKTSNIQRLEPKTCISLIYMNIAETYPYVLKFQTLRCLLRRWSSVSAMKQNKYWASYQHSKQVKKLLISNFSRVIKVMFFLLGDSQATEVKKVSLLY